MALPSSKLVEIARTSHTSILMYPARNLVTAMCILSALCPFFVGQGISRGIRAEAAASVVGGADLYVSGLELGQRVPLDQELQVSLAGIDGVSSVVPRIVASVELGRRREHAVIVGLPLSHFPNSIVCVEGRLPRSADRNELVLGVDLARRLKLEVGDNIPPFYHSDRGERISKVVGLFHSDLSLWQANLMLTSLETAGAILNRPGMVTDFLLYCRPGVQPFVRDQIPRALSGTDGMDIGCTVTSREDLEVLLPKGILHREGIFNLHFVLVFIAAIFAVLVTSGYGHSERRREIGILKATGWQTDEVLLRSLIEGLLLSVACACIAILLGVFWLKMLNGYWIASVFLTGVETNPAFRVPFRIFPGPTLITLAISLACTMTGTLYSTWRAATVSPLVAMR